MDDAANGEALFDLWHEWSDRANVYVECETAMTAYYPIDDVVSGKYRHMPEGQRGELSIDDLRYAVDHIVTVQLEKGKTP